MSDTEIERRVFQYGDHGEVTATRIRLTPPGGFHGFPADVMPKAVAQAIYLRAPWGQKIVSSAGMPPLADMTDEELTGLCQKAFFGPRATAPTDLEPQGQ